MANSFFVVFAAVILLHIGNGKDIRWTKNSNWDNVDNWQLGRLPCKGDIASFYQVTPLKGQIPLIYFNANSTVRKLVLPRSGKIVLKRSVTIRLTANESCEVPANTVPIAATGGEVNNFIGARANKWECPQNWAVDDNSSVESAPCGSDVAVLPSDSAFSYITSEMQKTVFVEFILLRDHKPENFDRYKNELVLNVSVNTQCQSNPDLCPCIKVDSNCNIVSSVSTATIGSSTVMPTMSSTSTASSLVISSLTQSLSSSAVISSSSSASELSTTTIGIVDHSTSVSVPIIDISSGTIGPVATAANTGNDGGNGGVVGGIVGVIVVLIIVAIVIVIITIILVRRRRYIQPKHAHLEEDVHAVASKESGTASYDNPTYESYSIRSEDADQLVNPLY